ncbi:sugar phosphate isomerase/epimerase family protein [Synoicihabitans lomoniglobus]|uniref:Sugar phosphate isomerase/epimerase n=1 Tax=Synoicihabitans lomoniglobus TaxID=2909285 RepID=A0AAE9ZXL9_9BACT|nr:sugar phosphate isomerase/epimerase [Opitutaceae bacterium LMO-M01]WED65154.1 sugar phosphate isomerase/epimerase [Opitutaceae bacterium LMO-M01]
MQRAQISVNLYSVREHLLTVDAFQHSMARLAGIGFQSVQLSGVDVDLMPAAEFVRICADHGLTITSAHEPSVRLLAEPQWSIDRLRALGVTDTAYPFPRDIDFGDPAAVDRWLRALDEAAAQLAAAGITLAYHNHHQEFTRVRGKLLYDRIFEETSLAGEPDTYWIQMGGGDPLAWTRRWAEAGRLSLLHLKDVRITSTGETRFGELGSGSLDFAPILAAAEVGGCRSYIIEQDQSYERDPFDAVGKSFAFLRDNFCA